MHDKSLAPKRLKTTPYLQARPEYTSSLPFCEYEKYLKSVYKKVLLPDSQTKWPKLRIRKAINLACIKREVYDPFQADDFTKSTIHGNVDDILHRKEQIELRQVACLQDDKSFQDCVLVAGAPGAGKTTLAQMLCRGWMQGNLLNWYSLVVLLRLREERVQKASQIPDLFYYSNLRVQESLAREIEKQQGSHVLLILEGFDELPQELQQSGFLAEVITGKCLVNCTKLITSRHSATPVLCRCANITQRIEVLGFTKQNIDEYIVSVLESNKPMLAQFQQYLSRYGFIKSMMYVPLNCAVVVEVYRSQRDEASVPKSSAQLYQCLLRSLLIRYLLDTPPYNALSMEQNTRLQSIEQLPREVHAQLMRLCEMAYDGIMNHKLIFSQDPGDHLGLIDAIPELYVDGDKVSYNFLHLTLQEFLAALHLLARFHADTSVNLSDIFEKHKDHPQVLIFLAGLTKLQAFDRGILKHNMFSADCRKDQDCHKVSSTIHWLFEAQDPELIGAVLCEGTVHFRPVNAPTPFDCHSLGYCIAHSSCQWEIDLSDWGLLDESLTMLAEGATSKQVTQGEVTQLDLRNNQCTSEGLQCLAGAPFMRGIQELNISKNKFDGEVCTILATQHFLRTMASMENICLSLNALGSGSTVPLLQELHTLPHLIELGLYDTGIGYKDIEVLCEKLPAMHNLYLVDIGNNQLSSMSVDLVIETLLSGIPLKRLSMAYTELSSKQVGLLATVIRVNHNLYGLSLQGCGVLSDGVCKLASALSEPDCVFRILSLNENNIGPEGGKAMADMVAVNTSLIQLHLGRADIGKEATLLILENHRRNAKTSVNYIQLCRKYQPEEIQTTINISWQ